MLPKETLNTSALSQYFPIFKQNQVLQRTKFELYWRLDCAQRSLSAQQNNEQLNRVCVFLTYVHVISITSLVNVFDSMKLAENYFNCTL